MSMGANKSGENGEQLSAAKRLSAMKPLTPKRRFLISWDAPRKLLRFGCGYGQNAVTICSNRKLEEAIWTEDSAAKLPTACVQQFRANSLKVEGPHLLSRCQAFLHSYVHMRDNRLYGLLAVWSIGTYVYPLFSHYGYLFLHSKFPRSGKTRGEESLSHL